MDYGSVYTVTWWGAVNELNNWGIVYPFDSDDSNFRCDTTLVTSDETIYTADQTKF